MTILDLSASRDDWRESLARLEQCTEEVREVTADLRKPRPLPDVEKQDDAERRLRIYDYADYLREVGRRARMLARWMRG